MKTLRIIIYLISTILLMYSFIDHENLGIISPVLAYCSGAGVMFSRIGDILNENKG